MLSRGQIDYRPALNRIRHTTRTTTINFFAHACLRCPITALRVPPISTLGALRAALCGTSRWLASSV